MASASTSKSSSINTQSSRNLEIQARPVNTRLPSNCTASFKLNGESLDGSAWSTPAPDQRSQESGERSHTPIETSNFERNYPSSDFNTSDHRSSLASSRSSTSLASSFNTVIQLSTTSLADPAPTSEVAQGSFLESRSDSSQLLNEIVAKSIAENQSNSNPDALDSAELADSKAARIQFHNVVRISGGITSNPKRKRANKQLPNQIQVDRHRPTSVGPNRADTSRSPLGRSSFRNGSSRHTHRISSPSPVSPSRPREPQRFDTHASYSSSSSSVQNNRPDTLKLSPPSTRPSYSSQSRNHSSSPSAHHNADVQPTFLRSFGRTNSMTSSVTGSIGYSATIISRSSSPASSLYLPLRVPIVRAPAPSYGPTPGRVARVRERRQVAQRDAERAKGGWKAWWNDWYYQSDRFAARKGKGKQDSSHAGHEEHDHSHCHSHHLEDTDSDDGSCYHDVILEHERKKLERKLERVKQIRPNIDPRKLESSSAHQSKRKRPNPEKTDTKKTQSWLSWASSIIIGLPPSPVHPLLLPKPGSGILRRPTLATTALLPGQPILPIISQDPTYNEHHCHVDSRTPLLSRPSMSSNYGHYSPAEIEEADRSTDSCSRIKTSIDVRFGLAPRRWFSFHWWSWKLQSLFIGAFRTLKSAFVGLFHVDWDDVDGRYEGWENA
ncbi:hypothetical protein MJO28_007748 [Puccinia striiformis f. sp. tritici]|uniref:Uncharacterized protein n=1 Tax=Puccinia striiformis f. sp. tritici TaxID=168172 RepID=A0ACC0EH17_9BASI|nr:hypothetical protein Pst134EB_014802 [Puccinia striiformis f. sp. tritici]KAI7952064.1 hypothetical protein MJO28_007748 [Puccinia striiformis f. sp. tritici]